MGKGAKMAPQAEEKKNATRILNSALRILISALRILNSALWIWKSATRILESWPWGYRSARPLGSWSQHNCLFLWACIVISVPSPCVISGPAVLGTWSGWCTGLSSPSSHRWRLSATFSCPSGSPSITSWRSASSYGSSLLLPRVRSVFAYRYLKGTVSRDGFGFDDTYG